jgi:drug/metabolite transporter (DMT)-like permease
MRDRDRAAKSSRQPSAWATHLALAVVQVAFASQAVEAKIAMAPKSEGGEGIPAEAIAMVRMVGAALFFQVLLASFPAVSGPRTPLSMRVHGKLVGLSILGVALNQALFLAGLRISGPVVVSLLGATIPVFASALAVLFRKELASWRMGLGLLLAVSGILWLSGVGSVRALDALDGLDRGAILVALNCLSYAAYVVFSRSTVVALGPLRTMAWVFLYGALIFAPLGVAPLAHALPALTPRGIGFLLYIVLVPTIVAYGLNAWALGRSKASTVTMYIYVQPLLAAGLAWVQLGTTVPSRAWLAAALILGGVAVATSKRYARKAAASPSSTTG